MSVLRAPAPLRMIALLAVLLVSVAAPAGSVVAGPDAPAGTALQFDGTNDFVTFGDTRLTPGTLACAGTACTLPAWNTIANSKLGGSSLSFAYNSTGGTGQYVKMGYAPDLGAASFTLETWFYWTGSGATTTTSGSTGGGLLTAIPLVTKGRGETDSSDNRDMNYFLGIQGSKLAADFEEGPGGPGPLGQNHAILGNTTITTNEWHHAAATYDSMTAVWSLYLDGSPDATLDLGSNVLPRADSIQHAAIASALNSTGVAEGFFAGRMDEVRIWNYARTHSQILATMSSEILVPETGLLGRWGMNDRRDNANATSTTAANLNRLGVTSFTLEVWVNRTAGGITMSTGTGGLEGTGGRPQAHPVLAKGMGEGEYPANINTNWFLGITSDGFVGADFEDTAGGGNHPAWGTTPIAAGSGWHHIAATYTGSCWALFVDGNSDPLNAAATACPNATPESTSYQRAALSAGINSSGGLGAGYFSGIIDEARVWNRALSATEIANNRYVELASGDGLIARWGLNEGAGTTTNSSLGSFQGTLTNGPTWVTGFPDNVAPGAPLKLSAIGAPGKVDLSWAAPEDSDIEGYNIYRSTTTPVPTTTPLNGALVKALTYADASGVPGTTYYYVVIAADTSGNTSAASNEASASPLAENNPPAAPTGLVAAPGDQQVTLTWATNTEPDAAGYNVYRLDAGPSYTKLNGALLTDRSYTATSLSNGTSYTYVVTCVDTNANESGYSASTSATPAEYALQFDGTNDYVTFGNPAGLGLSHFTIETWLKRSGNGVAVSTGSNGVMAVPLVTKGSPQDDGSNVDENYILGIRSSDWVLAGDFEIAAACGSRPAGDNNPITGITPIAIDTWYHAAFTYDGAALRLYLNGSLEATRVSNCLPRSDSIQHAGLGTYLTSTGTSSGYFAGTLDEVRIWGRALSIDEILANINLELVSGSGLVARWGMIEGYGGTTASSVGTLPGTLTNGPVWLTPGAPFNVAMPEPPAAPTMLSASATAGLQIDLTWQDNSATESGFKVERSPDGSTAWTEVGTTGADNAVYTDSGLEPITRYCYRVRAYNEGGDSAYTDTACATTPENPNNALLFGVPSSSFVSFGQAPALGVRIFTIEAWIRRDGLGATADTGTSGVIAVPLVTKGRHESDGSNVDMNYFVGIRGTDGVLVADFEQCDPAAADCPDVGTAGLNHPIAGRTPIPADGTWHHVAATYDGATWKLYVDGVEDGSLTLSGGPLPRWDSVQHAALATTLNSSTNEAAEGYFNGVLDEVRIWSVARNEAELQATANARLTEPQTGLIARWGLDEGAGTVIHNSAGTTLDGTIKNSNWSWVPGAPFNLTFNHQPANPTLVAPADGATGVGVSPALSVIVNDADDDELTVTFYGRPRAAAGQDFTVVVLPDTQYYSQNVSYSVSNACTSGSATFNKQTQWAVDNVSAKGVAFLTHVGDITETGADAQWQVADAAFDILDLAGTVPYGAAVGNHDQGSSWAGYNSYFGTSRYSAKTWYGGHYGSDNLNHYETFTASGLEFLVVHLASNSNYSPDPNALAWANNLLLANPGKLAIVVAHDLVNTSNALSAMGQTIYNALKDNDNFFLMLGGHYPGEGLVTLSPEPGRPVYGMLSDYQSRSNGGSGWLRLLEFSPANDEIRVKTYSPCLDQYETDANSQFALNYDMAGSGGFAIIGTPQSVSSGGTASVNWPSLDEGTEYEWYVVVADNKSRTTGPTWSFTAGAPLAVNMAALDAVATSEGIQLTWASVTERDNAGFNVFRGSAPNGEATRLNQTMIPAQQPGSAEGHQYSYLDASELIAGATYFYWVEDVSISGQLTQHGPVSVAAPKIPNTVGLNGFTAGAGFAPGLSLLVGALLAAAAFRWATRRE